MNPGWLWDSEILDNDVITDDSVRSAIDKHGVNTPDDNNNFIIDFSFTVEESNYDVIISYNPHLIRENCFYLPLDFYYRDRSERLIKLLKNDTSGYYTRMPFIDIHLYDDENNHKYKNILDFIDKNEMGIIIRIIFKNHHKKTGSLTEIVFDQLEKLL